MTRMTGPDCAVMCNLINTHTPGRPGSSEVPRNPLTRWDVSSIPANGIFLTKNLKIKIKMPNGWRTIKSLVVHKIRLHSRRGKGMAESFSQEKLRRTHRRKKVNEKSCVTPAGTSNELDVQNEWEENTHTHTHTHTKRKKNKYRGSFPATYSLLPLAIYADMW